MNFIISTNDTITMVLQGKPYTATTDHPNYDKIKESLKDVELSDQERMTMFDVQKQVSETLHQTSAGKVTLQNGQVLYDGEVLHSSLTDRILSLVRDGFSDRADSFVLFLENLMENTSAQSIQELFDFLSNAGLPITEDGHFLAYKGVRGDFKDQHSGKFDNSPGSTPRILRREVDDNRERTCSYGLHVGTYDYAKSFAPADGYVVLVKVNPKDVVSVPLDCNAGKCRTCAYEVLEVYKASEELDKSLYSGQGEPLVESPIATADTTQEELDSQITYYLNRYSRDELECAVDMMDTPDDRVIQSNTMSDLDLATVLAHDALELNMESLLNRLDAAAKKDPEKTHDFNDGNGPVPAHKHSNGGGWVADTACVELSAYVGKNTEVYGDARVYEHAQVYGNAKVYGNAWVYGWARVHGNAQVYGDAQVFGEAQVYGDAEVCEAVEVYEAACVYETAKVRGYTQVSGCAWVYGNAVVCEAAEVRGNARVYGNAKVYGDAKVYGKARVSGNACVSGDVGVFENAQVYENAKVFGGAWVYGNAKVYGDAHVWDNARVYGNVEVCEFTAVFGHAHVYEEQHTTVCDATEGLDRY